jgi:hypothetical protein
VTTDKQPFPVDPLSVMGDVRSNVERHFGIEVVGAAPFDGAAFESYGTNDPLRVTPDDLIAVTMLSIQLSGTSQSLRPQHAVALEAHARDIERLLARLPNDQDLADLEEGEAEQLLAWDAAAPSPARELYELLRRGLATATNPGRVAVYKLLARKRPRLLAIRDGVVEAALEHVRPDPWWMPWWYVFERDRRSGGELRTALEAARSSLPEPEHLSLLRAADVAIWMENRRTRETADE